MEKTERLLEVGDTVYVDRRIGGVSPHPIERVTRTTAVSGGRVFYRKISEEGRVDIKGADVWGPHGGWLETPELKKRHEESLVRSGALGVIYATDWKSLPTWVLQEIQGLIERNGKEDKI